MIKRVFEEHPGGRRKMDRPRKRWLDDIEEHVRVIKVKTWRNKTTEREVPARTVWEAMRAVAPRSQ
jgi:hypothetical protein